MEKKKYYTNEDVRNTLLEIIKILRENNVSEEVIKKLENLMF